jgi:hypothetical protein
MQLLLFVFFITLTLIPAFTITTAIFTHMHPLPVNNSLLYLHQGSIFA